MPVTLNGSTVTFTSGAVIEAPNGSAPLYMARAWVNFNGTGTVAIQASGNVSSITDNGTGNYTVNFSTAIVDASYAALVSGHDSTTAVTNRVNMHTDTLSTSSFRVRTMTPLGSMSDCAGVYCAVLR